MIILVYFFFQTQLSTRVENWLLLRYEFARFEGGLCRADI